MKAFKCDICGGYYSQIYDTDIDLIPQELSPICCGIYAHHQSLINIETFDFEIHDPVRWDLCKKCRNALNKMTIEFIKEKRKESGWS